MKRMIMLAAAILLLCMAATAQEQPGAAPTDNAVDPKNNPGPVDFEKHPEIMAKVKEMLYNGDIVYCNRSRAVDTSLDLSKHPELVRAIINNPNNWSIILKAYRSNDTLTVAGKNKQVIRDIIAYLVREHIVKNRQHIDSFLLTDSEFTVNGKKIAEKRHNYLKEQYILRPGYVVYFGNSEMKGDGIFQRTDNL